MVAVCLALGAVSAGLSTLHLSFVALGIGLALAGGTYTLFSAGGLWLNFTFPVLSILLTYSALTIYAYLTPALRMSLEESIGFIAEDEMVEVTPGSTRLRKHIASNDARYRQSRGKSRALSLTGASSAERM